MSFQLGRMGFHQVLYWLAGTPVHKNPSGGESGVICSLLGIPTSLEDLVADAINLSPIKTSYDLAKYVYGNFGGPLAYFATLFGRAFGRIWFFVGIPILILNILIAPNYFPPWIEGLGLTKWSFGGALFLGYLLSYSMGTMIPAIQKRCNRARLIYERQVAEYGYWFDGFMERHFRYSRRELERAEAIFLQIRDILGNVPVSSSLLLQRKMVLEYQMALLFASMQRYDEALRAVCAAAVWREELRQSNIWEPGEYDITKSQMLFLEGELLYV